MHIIVLQWCSRNAHIAWCCVRVKVIRFHFFLAGDTCVSGLRIHDRLYVICEWCFCRCGAVRCGHIALDAISSPWLCQTQTTRYITNRSRASKVVPHFSWRFLHTPETTQNSTNKTGSTLGSHMLWIRPSDASCTLPLGAMAKGWLRCYGNAVRFAVATIQSRSSTTAFRGRCICAIGEQCRVVRNSGEETQGETDSLAISASHQTIGDDVQ